MSERKLCGTCAHANFALRDPRCMAFQVEKDDLIWGHHFVVDPRPLLEIRADESACGPDGKFWLQAAWLREAEKRNQAKVTPTAPEPVEAARYEEDVPRTDVRPWWKFIGNAWRRL